jgi:hypothetical protein
MSAMRRSLPRTGAMGRVGVRVQIGNNALGTATSAHFLQIPPQSRSRSGQGYHRHRQFACGVFTLSQFGVGFISISQFTIAGFALAQFAIAYSLIARMGLYTHKGHGQLVRSLTGLLGWL